MRIYVGLLVVMAAIVIAPAASLAGSEQNLQDAFRSDRIDGALHDELGRTLGNDATGTSGFDCVDSESKMLIARRGCCSHHGGVCGCDRSSDRIVCCDGSLSPSCTCSGY